MSLIHNPGTYTLVFPIMAGNTHKYGPFEDLLFFSSTKMGRIFPLLS